MRISDWSSDVCSSDLPDMEVMLRSGGIGRNEIVGDSRCREALSVDRDLELVKQMGFRSARAEQADIGRPGNAAGDDGGGIMVAGEKEHRDFGPIQAAHGAGEIEAGAHVLTLTVEEVARTHDAFHIYVNGALYQTVQ